MTRETPYRPFPQNESRNARQERLELPLFVRALGLAGCSRIIEIGCGAGIALPVLHRLCAPDMLIGLDIDGAALASARLRTRGLGNGVMLIQGDVRRLPFPDAHFDAVVDFGTCYHISGVEQAIAEIERVLEPTGVFATETKLSQLLSHPVRSHGRELRLPAGSMLRVQRHRALWVSFEKTPRASVAGAESADSKPGS